MNDDQFDKMFGGLTFFVLLVFLVAFGVGIWAVIEIVQWLVTK